MTCDEAQKRRHLRYDNGREDVELEQHLHLCESCRVYDQRMQHLLGAFGALRAETESLTAPVPPTHDRVRRLPHAARWTGWRAAAAVLIVLTAGLYFRTVIDAPAPPAPWSDTPVRPSDAGSEDHLGLTLRGQSAERFLAVPRRASQSDVRVFWLYPSVPRVAETNQSSM